MMNGNAREVRLIGYEELPLRSPQQHMFLIFESVCLKFLCDTNCLAGLALRFPSLDE